MNVLNNNAGEILLSIVMPAYNSEKYISKCIESIRCQNDINWELIIVNDGSSDDTEEVCNRHAKLDTRIKLFTQENAGCTAARRKGILESKGNYILNVDSDDYLTSNAMKVLEKHISSDEYDIIQFSHYEIFNRIKFRKKVSCYSIDREEVFSNKIIDLLGGWNRTITPNVWDKVYKGNILREVMCNFNESISIGEDILINLKYFENPQFCRMKSVESAFYVYRKEIGIMSNTSWRDLKNYNVLKLNQIEYINKHNLSENERFHCYWEIVGIVRYATITLLQSNKSDEEVNKLVDVFFDMEFVRTAKKYLNGIKALPVDAQEVNYINDFCNLKRDDYIVKVNDILKNVSIQTRIREHTKNIIKRII